MTRQRPSRLVRLLLGLLLGAAIVAGVLNRDALDTTALAQWVTEAGWAGPLLFILFYALATVLFVPGTVVTLAGGALFGPVWGTLYNLFGATLGAAFAFLVARYLGAGWVEQRLGGRLGRLVRGVEAEGWRFVAFSRLVPLFPFNLLNYALGVTRIPFAPYFAATLVFTIPGAAAYTWLGYAAREAATGAEEVVQKIIIALALLATLAFLPRLVGRLRQRPMLDIAAVRQRLEAGEPLLLLEVGPTEMPDDEPAGLGATVNIPLEELEGRLGELADWQERPVGIVAGTRRRATRAADLLARNGFGDVHVVRGRVAAATPGRHRLSRIR